jgi:hypothetical protein
VVKRCEPDRAEPRPHHVGRRPGAQEGRRRRQELPHRARGLRAQPAHHDVPRLRRGPGPASPGGPHGRLGDADRPLPGLQRARGARRAGAGVGGVRQGDHRRAVRRVRAASPRRGGRAGSARGVGRPARADRHRARPADEDEP